LSIIDRFILINRRVAEAITPNHVHEANVFGMYRKLGPVLMAHPRVSTVVDVGAGKSWQFPPHYKDWFNIRLIGLDIDASEMLNNTLLDDKIECDVVSEIPLEAGSVDLFLIHSGIEHFCDNELVLRNMFRALRPGGFILAQFPNRYAPFAIANQLLPQKVTKWLLTKFMGPATELGYRAYYDRTNYSAFRKILQNVGFDEVYYLPGFFSSSYFGFFLPLFICAYLVDTLCYGLGIKNLASYNLWILQRPEATTVDEPFRFYAWR
jgi:ubiquinone/menaquinone biosynthesis C-methylase UbiE